MTDFRSEKNIDGKNPDQKGFLNISFWIWALWDTGKNGFCNDFDLRMAELVERGFNCIRIESGACLTHDAEGKPRGELNFAPALPGHGYFTRQLEHMTGGRVDLMKRLIELCTVAQRYQVKVILSSWYFLHTFWFTENCLTSELFSVPPEERFMYFAQGLHYILRELKPRGLGNVIAVAEIFNEVDGLDFVGGYGEKKKPIEILHRFRTKHEEAIDFLIEQHPEIKFAFDTYTPWTNTDYVPRNAQVWNFHSYYLWDVYKIFEGNLLACDADLNDPNLYEPIRHFLRKDLIQFQTILDCREERLPIAHDWYRRIWLYRNLDPNAITKLERLLQENLEKNMENYKQKATAAAEQAVKLRDEKFPGIPLILGEGASYCADNRMRWEERSDAYWEVVEHAARTYRKLGFWGAVVRTNSGPEDPVWHEFPERLQRINAILLGKI